VAESGFKSESRKCQLADSGQRSRLVSRSCSCSTCCWCGGGRFPPPLSHSRSLAVSPQQLAWKRILTRSIGAIKVRETIPAMLPAIKYSCVVREEGGVRRCHGRSGAALVASQRPLLRMHRFCTRSGRHRASCRRRAVPSCTWPDPGPSKPPCSRCVVSRCVVSRGAGAITPAPHRRRPRPRVPPARRRSSRALTRPPRACAATSRGPARAARSGARGRTALLMLFEVRSKKKQALNNIQRRAHRYQYAAQEGEAREGSADGGAAAGGARGRCRPKRCPSLQARRGRKGVGLTLTLAALALRAATPGV